jgi:hypothetical protein
MKAIHLNCMDHRRVPLLEEIAKPPHATAFLVTLPMVVDSWGAMDEGPLPGETWEVRDNMRAVCVHTQEVCGHRYSMSYALPGKGV